MHADLRALGRLVAVPDDEVIDAELKGNVALGLVDVRPLQGHDEAD
jgi:hypothetical protein